MKINQINQQVKNKMDNSAILLDNLRELVKNSGRSQKELAADAGITPVTLNRWLQGKREPREEELTRLLGVLGVSAEIIRKSDNLTKEGQPTDTLEAWKARALRAESELAVLKGSSGPYEGMTAEEYLARLHSSMRFVLSFITKETFTP